MPKDTWFNRLIAALLPPKTREPLYRDSAGHTSECYSGHREKYPVMGAYLPHFLWEVRTAFDAARGRTDQHTLYFIILEVVEERKKTDPKIYIHLLEDCLYAVEEIGVDWESMWPRWGTSDSHVGMIEGLLIRIVIQILLDEELYVTPEGGTATEQEDARRQEQNDAFWEFQHAQWNAASAAARAARDTS